jgi:hypothetical protein
MKSSRHQSLVVLLVAGLHLAVTVGGEALHYVPGMGHCEEMPGGVCVWHGGAPDHDTPFRPVHPDGDVTEPPEQPGANLDPDECPICHLASQAGGRAGPICWLPTLHFLGQFRFSEPPSVAFAPVTQNGARAPPC